MHEKPSHGFAIHTRREKAAARREQPFALIPSWANVSNTLELRTHNSDIMNELFLQNRALLKEFYDARYAKFIGNGDKKLKKFIKKYTTNEKSRFYNPELIEEMEPLLAIVRDSFPKNKMKK